MTGLTQDQKIKLKSLLIKHEGNKDYPYFDNQNPPNLIIGIGRNLSSVGIREDEKDLMFKNDVDFLFQYFSVTYAWFQQLNEERQLAIVDMAFMGIKNFISFKRMITALEEHDYNKAYNEILDSEYARKQPIRAHDIANIIKEGIL